MKLLQTWFLDNRMRFSGCRNLFVPSLKPTLWKHGRGVFEPKTPYPSQIKGILQFRQVLFRTERMYVGTLKWRFFILISTASKNAEYMNQIKEGLDKCLEYSWNCPVVLFKVFSPSDWNSSFSAYKFFYHIKCNLFNVQNIFFATRPLKRFLFWQWFLIILVFLNRYTTLLLRLC